MTMRRILIPLLLLLLSACDSLADFGGGCTGEKSSVRLREGRAPDDTDKSEVAGDFTERWTYQDSGGTRYYTFRWGVSYGSCQVDGPGSFSVIPLTL
jgi:hypothetical protein